MRTITNLFLLNLAVSDLFLGVFCMPFTLVGTLLRDFVFGEVMCKLLPYLQASSVAVSAWTLVIISVERYYAICHPLRSRRWQTLSHAYRLIALIWCGSLFFMLPIAVLSKLIPTNQGHHKCRELWFDRGYERAYNLLLDVILLVLPLLILAVTYSLITRTLCRGMNDFRRYSKALSTRTGDGKQAAAAGRERSLRPLNNNNRAVRSDQYMEVYIRPNGSTKTRCPSIKCHRTTTAATTATATTTTTTTAATAASSAETMATTTAVMNVTAETVPGNDVNAVVVSWNPHSDSSSSPPFRSYSSAFGGKESLRLKNPALRKSNMEKSLTNKKRIIKMLFVVVLEFFICWTPLYVINTMALFWPSTVYHNLGYTAISFFQLLAYSSSCCNPITYCFMSSGFRKAFLNLFRCFRPGSGGGRNRRNSSAMGGLYVASGCSTASGVGTIALLGRYSSRRKQTQHSTRDGDTIDTILDTDGVVSLKHRNDNVSAGGNHSQLNVHHRYLHHHHHHHRDHQVQE
ncbi:cholecystokinin receptor type A-like [Ochlerotatus camptorhynchus]|uniref:cholecystokinin receptor type A-like n=1 Tax=Ochlerotatus camptorhynchus TaxID=644619 RepID=UPI0031CF3AD3